MTFKIRIAQRVIEIHSLFDDVYSHCKGYYTDAEPDITVATTQEDILFEKERALEEHAAQGGMLTKLPDGYLEISAVYRKICEAMLPHGVLLMHGSVVAVGNEAYMFTAASGTGKTTHTRLWLKNFENSYVVNGDKPLLIVSDAVYACGTPWSGKERMNKNTEVLLKAIVILERGKDNSITKLSGTEALPMLLQQSYRPVDGEMMSETLQLIKRIISGVGLYRLKCNMEDQAALTAYRFIKQTSE